MQGINSFADRGIVFNDIGVRVFYFINLTHGLDLFFNERFLFVNDKWLRKDMDVRQSSIFVLLETCGTGVAVPVVFLFSKHKRFLLFKYHADHRLVYMLVIILFATADNAKVWSERGHVFAYVEKYPSFS